MFLHSSCGFRYLTIGSVSVPANAVSLPRAPRPFSFTFWPRLQTFFSFPCIAIFLKTTEPTQEQGSAWALHLSQTATVQRFCRATLASPTHSRALVSAGVGRGDDGGEETSRDEQRRAETVNPTAMRRLKRVSLIECLCAQIANDDSTRSACDVHGPPLNNLDNLHDTPCLSQPETFSIYSQSNASVVRHEADRPPPPLARHGDMMIPQPRQADVFLESHD